MGRKLYVGNLTYDVTDSALEQMFAAHGTVQSAQVIMDRDTGRSKGFGFVEMGSDQEAQAAIEWHHTVVTAPDDQALGLHLAELLREVTPGRGRRLGRVGAMGSESRLKALLEQFVG